MLALKLCRSPERVADLVDGDRFDALADELFELLAGRLPAAGLQGHRAKGQLLGDPFGILANRVVLAGMLATRLRPIVARQAQRVLRRKVQVAVQPSAAEGFGPVGLGE